MLQFDLQFYEELTVAWVRTVKFISGAFFWPTGQHVLHLHHPCPEPASWQFLMFDCSYTKIDQYKQSLLTETVFEIKPVLMCEGWSDEHWLLYDMLSTPGGNKMSMLTHTYPHKQWPSVITRLTCHLTCGLLSNFMTYKQKSSMAWHPSAHTMCD